MSESYYGRPIIKSPVWEPLDIAGYLFLGGLAGASSTLAAAAEFTGRPGLARPSKLGAAIAVGASLVALVHDLGRPGRFFNMLRVLKPTSPMSVGSWLLAGYAPAAFAAAASDLTGFAPAFGTAATAIAALTGPAVASYTAVLIADTAVPAWHSAHRQLPFIFASSAASAASGLALMAAPLKECGPARRLAVAAATIEITTSRQMKARIGLPAEAYTQGNAGVLTKAAEALTVAGAAAALLGRRSRVASAAGGVALVAGSALTRFAIFEAGVASARDPKYTVIPQQERLQTRAVPKDPS